MESLADLFKKSPELSFVKSTEQITAKLLQEPLIKKLIQEHPEIEGELLQRNLVKLHQYVTEAEHCRQCPGLERCPNDFAGHATKLTVEKVQNQPQLYDHKVPCQLYINKQRQDLIKRRIRSFYVDEQALEEGYSSSDIIEKDLNRRKAVRQVMNYILKTKQSGLQKEGLFLTGSLGTGKTFLMCYMLYELAKIGLNGAIVYMPDFIEELKSMFGEPQKLKETVEILKHTDLLVFDDIGAENLSPWARDHILGAILNHRMNRKPTFYTSNYELSGLEKHFSFTNKEGDEEFKGLRIMDRIKPFVEVVVVKGSNKRGKA